MKLSRPFLLLLTIIICLLSGCTNQKANIVQQPQPQQKPQSASVLNVGLPLNPGELNLINSEKKRWTVFFESIHLDLLPNVNINENIDDKVLIQSALGYILNQAKVEPNGYYKIEKAMWKKSGTLTNRIIAEDVEKAAKYLFDRPIKQHSSAMFEYDEGYYWFDNLQYPQTSFYKINKCIDNKNNTLTFYINCYDNLYLQGKAFHTEDGTEIKKEEFKKTILDKSTKILEQPIKQSKLTVKKLSKRGARRYFIIENINLAI